MPRETPAATVMSMAARVSCTVAGRRSSTTRRAGARYWKDWPKSPRATLPRKSPYWTTRGSRSPRTPAGRLRDADVTQENVVVAPRLEVLQTLAHPVDGHRVVEPELRVLVPHDALELLVLGLAHLGIGHAALRDELLHFRVRVARELLRARLGEPLPEVPVGIVGHVGPPGEEEVVSARGALLPRGGDFEVLDVELDAHVAQHGCHRLGDLELLGIEVLHEDDVD